ncbi:MaoC family dehydratase N-terminal domain-containing protein [Paraburkholderia hospita]|uniref:FAS1-like dehydratase domain-containing protein n=1 Tax=Paraburkholderia hospita TaxID=169430 RepID=UPI000DEEA916|nr:MaoC family dehydratase N-terminal domain-containing protein [Paraburkholderia hospita]AXF05580.1 acyl-CoA dehydrogenase [Paraburkholderia hospita]
MGKVYEEWVGRQRHTKDTVSIAPLRGLIAALDHPARKWLPGDAVPLLAHWLFFGEFAAQNELGDDGHPRRGDFLPPVSLPRRMWAGGRLRFHEPLRVDDELTRSSTITNVEAKSGSTGEFVFVTVRHDIVRADGKLLVEEEQDIVYREAVQVGHNQTSAVKAERPSAQPWAASVRPCGAFNDVGNRRWERPVAASATLLFRYSALTFNSHRIHYDREYATRVEGYPGLVVHGPLQATLMLDLLNSALPDARIESFSFRGRAPLLGINPFAVQAELRREGREVLLGTRTGAGIVAMEGVAVLSEPCDEETTGVIAHNQTSSSFVR